LGVPKKTLALQGQAGPRTIAHEQRYAQISLQALNPGTDRRLRHIQTIGRFQKTAVGDDAEKGFDLIDVHGFIIDIINIKV